MQSKSCIVSKWGTQAIALAVVFLSSVFFAALPVNAAEAGSFDSPIVWNFGAPPGGSPYLTTEDGKFYVVTGTFDDTMASDDTDPVILVRGVCTITLQDIHIVFAQAPLQNPFPPFNPQRTSLPIRVQPGAHLTLVLQGENRLQGLRGAEGIRVDSGATLTILGGNGRLTVQGGEGCDGIGGGGNVVINGGDITAAGGNGGTPNGSGGCGISGSSVVINGGIVTATGGAGWGNNQNYDTPFPMGNGGGAGIGIGQTPTFAWARVVVNGGRVTASGGNGADGDTFLPSQPFGGGGGGAGIGGSGAKGPFGPSEELPAISAYVELHVPASVTAGNGGNGMEKCGGGAGGALIGGGGGAGGNLISDSGQGTDGGAGEIHSYNGAGDGLYTTLGGVGGGGIPGESGSGGNGGFGSGGGGGGGYAHNLSAAGGDGGSADTGGGPGAPCAGAGPNESRGHGGACPPSTYTDHGFDTGTAMSDCWVNGKAGVYNNASNTWVVTLPKGFVGPFVPTFVLSPGATASLGGAAQHSGVTVCNFESYPDLTALYTISAGDGSTATVQLQLKFEEEPLALPPPSGIQYQSTSSGYVFQWQPVQGAAGYNIYVDGTRVNSAVVTGTAYTLPASYPAGTRVTISTVNSIGVEGIQSAPVILQAPSSGSSSGSSTNSSGAPSRSSARSSSGVSSSSSASSSSGSFSSGSSSQSSSSSVPGGSSHASSTLSGNTVPQTHDNACMLILIGIVIVAAAIVLFILLVLARRKKERD